ncbi:hypothetical protein A9Q92_07780 [Methylophaga sp. 42_8_T64]|nr:hypothetical protein A9Q92_07780 [Methylophaga sp. 42_8_T64]
MATNPVVTMPNAEKVKAALANCEVVVVSDCDAKTDTTEFATVLLPAHTWGEKDGTVTNSERRISHQRRFLPIAGEARPDWWIISQVAKRMGFADAFAYENPVEIFREHAALSSFENDGSRDFDLGAMAAISAEQYDDLKPIQWPVSTSKPAGTARLFEDKQFFTTTKKAQFIAVEATPPVNSPDKDYPLILNTGRIRDQWHTMTRSARSARLNGHIPEPFVEIHPDDASRWSITDGALAQIDSQWGRMIARVQVTESQQQGNVFVPMHWNAQYASLSRVDALVNPVVDPLSGQPEFKHTPVKVSQYKPAWHGFILSREPLVLEPQQYWIRIKGEQFWRYELAGEQAIDDGIAWAKAQLGAEGDWLEFSDSALHRFRAAKVIDDRLQSVVFIAAEYDMPARSWLSQLFVEENITDEMRLSLLAGKPGAGLPDVGPLVCACFGVGENTIKDAVSCGDAKTADDIGQLLKAGTNCGSCLPEIKKLIANS